MLKLLSSFSSKVYLIIITALITMLTTTLLGSWYLSTRVNNLEKDLINEKAITQQEIANNKVLAGQIDKQNIVIEQNKNEYDKKVKIFEEWKKKPIYRTIIKEIKSNECKDIKKLIDTIRTFDN